MRAALSLIVIGVFFPLTCAFFAHFPSYGGFFEQTTDAWIVFTTDVYGPSFKKGEAPGDIFDELTGGKSHGKGIEISMPNGCTLHFGGWESDIATFTKDFSERGLGMTGEHWYFTGTAVQKAGKRICLGWIAAGGLGLVGVGLLRIVWIKTQKTAHPKP